MFILTKLDKIIIITKGDKMDIELFDLIFESRMYQKAEYKEDGTLLLIPNIQEIFTEFYLAEQACLNLSYVIAEYDMIYQNMIKSYQLHPEFSEIPRKHYVLGMTFVEKMTRKKRYSSQKDLQNLVDKRWYYFQNFIHSKNYSTYFISDFSFQGILEQTKIDCMYKKPSQKKKK